MEPPGLYRAIVISCLVGVALTQGGTRRDYSVPYQKQWFAENFNGLGGRQVQPNNIPQGILDNIPSMMETVAGGGIEQIFAAGNPWVSALTGFFKVASNILKGWFHKVEPPNMPPVITCPPNIKRIADKSTRRATVFWAPAVAHDKEDGTLSPVLVSRARPGNSFSSGTHYIKYLVLDSQKRKDTCTFVIEVEVLMCPPLDFITRGKTDCHGRPSYGDKCNFTCDEGHKLQGKRTLTCQLDKTYSAPLPTCTVIQCPQPNLPEGGKSWNCSGRWNYGSTCTLICKDGFRIDGTNRAAFNYASQKCTGNGTWSDPPKCRDVAKPSFTYCHGYRRHYAERRRNSTIVTWQPLLASDRSGGEVTITQTKGQVNGSRFEVGAHLIEYEAVDRAGLKDTCGFYINIEMRSCRAPDVHGTYLDLECDSQFMHGAECNATCRQGIELAGSSNISCELVGEEMQWQMLNGTPKCLVKPCVKPTDPPNSWYSCNDYSGGKICNVKCNRGKVPARNANSRPVTCSPATGKWKNAIHPGCVSPRRPNAVRRGAMFYWKTTCSSSDAPAVEEEFSDILSYPIVVDGCSTCRIQNIEASCIKKKRRNTFLAVRWNIVKDVDANKASLTGAVALAENSVDRVVLNIRTWLSENFRNLNVTGNTSRLRKFRERKPTAVTCDSKFKADISSKTCAPCALGWEYDGSSGCRECPSDTYQDDQGNLACRSCSLGEFTVSSRSTHRNDCKKPCEKGTYSETGLAPCHACPVAQYQMFPKSIRCEDCPAGEITASLGSTRLQNCYMPATPVRRLRVKETGSDFVLLRWGSPDEENGLLLGYDIGYQTLIDHTLGVMTYPVNQIRNNRTSDFHVEGLEPNQMYRFSVWAVTEPGRGIVANLDAMTENVTETTTTLEPTTTTDPSVTPDPNACPPGTNSPSGVRPCYPCQYGFYQDKIGQMECNQCDTGLTTWNEGAQSVAECVDENLPTPTTTTTTTIAPLIPCPKGKVSKTGFKPGCKKCGRGKVPKTDRKSCKWCETDDNGNFVCSELSPL